MQTPQMKFTAIYGDIVFADNSATIHRVARVETIIAPTADVAEEIAEHNANFYYGGDYLIVEIFNSI